MWLDISTTSSGSLHLFQLPLFLFSFFSFRLSYSRRLCSRITRLCLPYLPFIEFDTENWLLARGLFKLFWGRSGGLIVWRTNGYGYCRSFFFFSSLLHSCNLWNFSSTIVRDLLLQLCECACRIIDHSVNESIFHFIETQTFGQFQTLSSHSTTMRVMQNKRITRCEKFHFTKFQSYTDYKILSNQLLEQNCTRNYNRFHFTFSWPT